MTNSKGTLAIVDPGIRVAELECFNDLAQRAPTPVSYHLPALFGLDSLNSLPIPPRGIIILGSGASPTDELPWQTQLLNWWLPMMERGIPTLGICYGHQLIAHALGGNVGFVHSDKRKLQGLRKIQIAGSRIWKEQEIELYVSHREQVSRAPSEMKVIAQSKEVSVEGLEHKSHPIWTLQAHPEATPGFLKNLGSSPIHNEEFLPGHRLVDSFLQNMSNH